MHFQRLSLDESAQATGTVVVIDVLRAFTSACYAFGAGASEITLVSEVSHAFDLKEQFPKALLMGEVGGAPIAGFDFSNSPTHYINCDLSDRPLIQRTSNGTQGVIRATQATETMAATFVCVGATARYIRHRSPSVVSFIITGWHAESSDTLEGDEDAACAEYLETLLTVGHADPTPFLARVTNSPTGKLFQNGSRSEYPPTDLPLCIAVDRFNFALPIERNTSGHLAMRPLAM